MISTGNFHTPALALGFDTLGLALAQVANLAVNRVQRLLTERLSALPTGLSTRGVTRVGYGAATKILEALAVEIRHLANPRSEEPTSELQSTMRISYAVFYVKKHN